METIEQKNKNKKDMYRSFTQLSNKLSLDAVQGQN